MNFPTPAEAAARRAAANAGNVEALKAAVLASMDEAPVGKEIWVDLHGLSVGREAMDVVCHQLAESGWHTRLSSSPRNESFLVLRPAE